jgi:nucleotide-binding universal stress UspA family protein
MQGGDPMINYSKILFPLDLSETSPVIAKHVLSMAQKFEAELHVLNVVPTYVGPTFASYNLVMDEIKEDAEKGIREFCGENFSDVQNLVIHAAMGHAGRQILKYADKNGIDLIIMGTHGRSGLGKVFFGSVAQRVVQSSIIPVLTVHPTEE